MGHIRCAHPGQGLLLRVWKGCSECTSRRLLRVSGLAFMLFWLAVQASVALVAELLGRFVIQRAVRTHRVVFAPKPAPFLLGVPVVLELLTLEELVTETAVER